MFREVCMAFQTGPSVCARFALLTRARVGSRNTKPSDRILHDEILLNLADAEHFEEENGLHCLEAIYGTKI